MNVNIFPCFNAFLPSFLFLAPVSGSGCVVMSGGPALGRWEVKNCRTFKALSLCKQSLYNDNDFHLPNYFNHPNAPCPPGWESQSELSLCFKVGLFTTENKCLKINHERVQVVQKHSFTDCVVHFTCVTCN